jgi:hypothetical protein
MQNPIDAMVAAKIGELELTKIRMAWALERQQGEMQKMSALLIAKDAEIERLNREMEQRERASADRAQKLDNLPSNPYAGDANAVTH